MRYDDALVEQVQSLNDIVEIVSAYVPMKKAGRNFKGLCPFHQEKTPSFMVNPEKQIFHCFGCGVGGDVFSFIMKYDNVTFPEALRQLAERAKVTLPERSENREASVAGKFYEIYDAAQQYYRKNFEESQAAREARSYLAGRGFDLKALAEFGIGFSLPEWRGLYDFLSRKGFPDEILVKSGLIVRAAQGNVYDFFRGRIMFPVFNTRGKVVAFGGRIIGKEGSPKYINSPETEIFQKRKEFYGLHLAKRFITEENPRIFIVEGYLDQIRLAAAGFKNTVATLGTSLTFDHLKVLRRYGAEAVLVYDGDKAGESAALRGLDLFLEEGMVVKLLALPGGLDPDDMIRERGAEAFRALAENAQDLFDFKLAVLMRRYKKDDTLGLVKITNDFLETFDRIQDSILLDRYVMKLSQALNIHENSIRQEVEKRRKKEKAPAGRDAGDGKKAAEPDQEEIILLGLILNDEGLREAIFREIGAEDFQSKEVGAHVRALRARHEAGEEISLSKFLGRITEPGLQSSMSRLSFQESDESTRHKAARDCIAKMKQKKAKRLFAELQMKIKQAEAGGLDRKIIDGYVKECQALLAAMK